MHITTVIAVTTFTLVTASAIPTQNQASNGNGNNNNAHSVTGTGAGAINDHDSADANALWILPARSNVSTADRIKRSHVIVDDMIMPYVERRAVIADPRDNRDKDSSGLNRRGWSHTDPSSNGVSASDRNTQGQQATQQAQSGNQKLDVQRTSSDNAAQNVQAQKGQHSQNGNQARGVSNNGAQSGQDQQGQHSQNDNQARGVGDNGAQAGQAQSAQPGQQSNSNPLTTDGRTDDVQNTQSGILKRSKLSASGRASDKLSQGQDSLVQRRSQSQADNQNQAGSQKNQDSQDLSKRNAACVFTTSTAGKVTRRAVAACDTVDLFFVSKRDVDAASSTTRYTDLWGDIVERSLACISTSSLVPTVEACATVQKRGVSASSGGRNTNNNNGDSNEDRVQTLNQRSELSPACVLTVANTQQIVPYP